MSITRHNYEEFFILYMDNELGSDERRMVEAFVQQHTDLKDELDVLLHYKLEPDTSVVFNGKEELMKVNGETPIGLSNYEEWLVMYADNELTAAQRRSVEEFAIADPSVQEELALMMKAKLEPEEIVFPYKGSLYRKEERRVVPFRWWRIAAAAVIILLAISAALLFNNKRSSGVDSPGVAEVGPGIKKQDTPSTNDQPATTTNPVAVGKDADEPGNETAVIVPEKQIPSPEIKQPGKNNAVAIKINNNPVVNNNSQANNSLTNKNEEKIIATVDNNKTSNDLPEPLDNPRIKKAEPTDLAISEKKNFSNPTTHLPELTKPGVTNPTAQPSDPGNPDVSFASLEEGDNKKSRGLFRKIARTFEKRTNAPATDDNRLLVAGLSFKLK